MPLGLLCSKGSNSEDDARVCRTNVELLDKTVLHLDLDKHTTGAGCLEIIGAKIGLSEVSLILIENFDGLSKWHYLTMVHELTNLCYGF